MKTSTLWIWRIVFILLCGMFPALSLMIGTGILPLLIGIGCIMLIVIFGLTPRGLSGNKAQLKFDSIMLRIGLIGAIFFIGGSFIKIKSDKYIYHNGDGYQITVGAHPNDTVTSSFMISIPKDSKILDYKNIMS